MRRRYGMALLFCLVATVGMVAWRVFQPREPVYQGKRLTSWLSVYQISGFESIGGLVGMKAREQADAAVREAGTNALPTLLRMLQAKDSFFRVKLMELANRQHVLTMQFTTAEDINYRALRAFMVLGAQAKSAVPALIQIARQNISPASQGFSICALGSIGPQAKDAVPLLMGWATNANSGMRLYAIGALNEIGAADKIVPMLTNDLHSADYNVFMGALWAFQACGPDAKRAVPALLEFIRTHNDAAGRPLATSALKKIDPQAAAKAEVR